ncbi:MAG: type II toxin-antitoxin system RelE/ParE family toxin [Prevotella sp.]|nr:type II toxin-antitoxin system RelE/ParE family toxin [Prevotella sp.]
MVHKVIVRKRALTQFQGICNYLADEFGDSIADRFEYQVENCVETLKRFPESGHIEAIDSKYLYRSKIVGEYTKMYYYQRGDTLVVAAFADMRMHPAHILRAIKG